MVVAFSASAQSGRERVFFYGGGRGGWGSTAIASSHTQNSSERKSEARAKRERISQSRPRPTSLRGRDRFSGSEALFLVPPRRWRQPETAAVTAPVRARPRLKAAANYSTLVGKSTGKKRKKTQPLSLFSLLSFSKQARAPTLSRSPRRPRRRTRKKRGQGAAPSSRASRTVRDEGEENVFFTFQKF